MHHFWRDRTRKLKYFNLGLFAFKLDQVIQNRNFSLKLKRLERIEAPRKRSPRNGQEGTSALGVLMHILKGNVGTGLLALPLGTISSIYIGIFNQHKI